MFSGAILDALRCGSDNEPEKLSLAVVGQMTWDLVKRKYPDEAVRPEVHSPDQRKGDIAVLPLFPNPVGRKTESQEVSWEEFYNLYDKREKTIEAIASSAGDQTNK